MIKLNNLSKYYYSSGSVATGLRKINLELEKGEFVAITGENGSGKSTLLNVISGMIPYEEGELFIHGETTSHYDANDWEEYRRDHIGFVFQSYRLIESYTVEQNVISALLLRGISYEEAKKKTKNYLEQVGLEGYETQKGSQLSSGQKQRLAIARALAKDTEILVADEPTGNLDTENGRNIMKLFSELAKDKLILVVTHDYEEAKPFVTRKIVIHDSELVEDIKLKDRDTQRKSSLKTKQNSQRKYLIWNFLRMNLSSQPLRGVFLTLFLLAAGFAGFIFYGNILSNLDDVTAKQYSNTYFYNSDPLRLIVRNREGTALTRDDLGVLQTLAHVKKTDLYGLTNDINYFCENGKDYITSYTASTSNDNSVVDSYDTNIFLNDFSKFVRTATGLKQEDLLWGELPSKANDIVIYTTDDTKLKETISYYFHNQRSWQTNSYIKMEMTICGILKEPTNQTYFSEKLGQALVMSAWKTGAEPVNYLQILQSQGENSRLYKKATLKDCIIYTDAAFDFTGQDIVLSKKTKQSYAECTKAYLTVSYDKGEGKIYDISKQMNESSEKMVAVPEKIFEQLAKELAGSSQIGVYLEDYAYADQVLEEIKRLGYEAISPFRASMRVYDPKKVSERLISLGIAFASFAILFLLQHILLRSLLRLKDEDYLTLRFLGMGRKIPVKLIAREMFFFAISSFIGTGFLIWISSGFIEQIAHLIKYYKPAQFFLLFILFLCNIESATFGYGRRLEKKLAVGQKNGGRL